MGDFFAGRKSPTAGDLTVRGVPPRARTSLSRRFISKQSWTVAKVTEGTRLEQLGRSSNLLTLINYRY